MDKPPRSHSSWKRHLERLPSVRRDLTFWAMTSTQFLGAFNDNLFKQLVLLLCTDMYRRSAAGPDSFQTLAGLFFALPFVMFSGFAGYLSDLYHKKTVIILCKMAEILVMLCGAIAFYYVSLPGLLVVLFFMGTQSAFFGPSKYGALPEMFRSRDLPYVNGVIIMTTFLAIIFGTFLAGLLWDSVTYSMLWLASAACIVTALVGTITSLFVRRSPIANPNLTFRWSTLAIDGPTWRLMRRDKPIRNVLYILSVFWMIGAVIQFAVNAFGRYQLAVSATRTSVMLVYVAAGIAIGCILAARLSKGQVSFRIYRVGNFILIVTLSILGFLASSKRWAPNHENDVRVAEAELSAARASQDLGAISRAEERVERVTNHPLTNFEWACRGLLFVTGIATGLFAVPLQTLLQVRPPDEEKGRVIAAMNFMTWIGILLASGAYFLLSSACYAWDLPQGIQFLACAVVMATMYLYRLGDPGEPPPLLSTTPATPAAT